MTEPCAPPDHPHCAPSAAALTFLIAHDVGIHDVAVHTKRVLEILPRRAPREVADEAALANANNLVSIRDLDLRLHDHRRRRLHDLGHCARPAFFCLLKDARRKLRPRETRYLFRPLLTNHARRAALVSASTGRGGGAERWPHWHS
eukprot:365042-Chlamydomonas_euryale.AAC.48